MDAAPSHLTSNHSLASCHVGFWFSTDCSGGKGNSAQKQHSSKKPAGSLKARGFPQIFVWSVCKQILKLRNELSLLSLLPLHRYTYCFTLHPFKKTFTNIPAYTPYSKHPWNEIADSCEAVGQLLCTFCATIGMTDQPVDKAKYKTSLMIYRFPNPNLIKAHND